MKAWELFEVFPSSREDKNDLFFPLSIVHSIDFPKK